MKLKFKLDGATIQDFLLHHVEKIVLAVVLLLLGLFIYMGSQLPSVAGLDSPEKLKELSARTLTNVNNAGAWTAIAPTRPVTADVPEQVSRGHNRIEDKHYALQQPWNRTDFDRHAPRTDPKIYAPLALKVVAIQGPLGLSTAKDGPGGAMAGPIAGGVQDPLSDDEEAGVGPGGEMSSRPPGAVPPPTGPGNATGKGKAATKEKGKSKRGPAIEGYETYPSEEHAMPPPTMYGSGGVTQAAGLRTRTEGFSPTTGGTFVAGKAVVVMAAVPWEKQYDEFMRALSSSLDYQPDRDFPRYLGFQVERADVTADPTADVSKLKWSKLSTAEARKETGTWMGFPGELLDPDYLDKMLTHPAPPFLNRDLTEAMLYPDIPLLADLLLDEQKSLQQPGQDNRPAANGDFPEQLEGPGGDQYSRERQMGPGGYGVAGAGRTRTPFVHWSPSNAGGGPGGPEMSMMNSGGPGVNNEKALAESVRTTKLIRFTDTTVEPRHVYRYRVKVLIEDPNRPQQTIREPLVQSLDNKVKERLAQTANAAKRIYWIDSEFSEASPPVSLPPAESFYSTYVTVSRLNAIRDDRPAVPDVEIKGRVLAVVYSDQKAVDVPATLDVHRGTTLNFIKDEKTPDAERKAAEVVHPVTGAIRKVKNFRFRTNSVVADIRGGETIRSLKNTNEGSLKTPGEMLVFDSRGDWHMLDETFDIDARMKHAPDDGEVSEETTPRPRPPSRTRPAPGQYPGMGPGAYPGMGPNTAPATKGRTGRSK